MKPFLASLLAASALSLSGCSTLTSLTNSEALTPSYEPSNVFRSAETLPKEIKRLAVLPLMVADSATDTEFGRESLGPVLLAELGKLRRFELVTVPPDELRRWTGRSQWGGEEKLPADFFEKLRDVLGCDAVLFCRLTQYRPYQPLAVGWRFRLLEADEPHLVWSVDEVFDSREPSVAAAARRYYQAHPDTARSVADPHTALVSPRRFAQYTAHAALGTMPGR